MCHTKLYSYNEWSGNRINKMQNCGIYYVTNKIKKTNFVPIIQKLNKVKQDGNIK